ncbi:MAG: hybrid sensor histidine kinase/response regulator [SAR324 cluster bacterium]|uniref:histidine kinase n=1 Tax=SAR324 cluster bacterium TaxID=2024889 RepID=A0A2A4T1A7_9DELT|nr:MAG: hybrid sensor histidine kinase/response regulator [SAR324 cluster bacterium]
MDQDLLFNKEEQIIEHAESVISAEQDQNCSLLWEYKELTRDYEKLFKQFRRNVRMSDLQQNRLQKSKVVIEAANRELQELNRTKDKFFSIIAHDLKNPINSFLGLGTVLVDHIDQFSRHEIREMAIDVKQSGENLFKLLENLLNWARLQMDKMQYSPKPYSLLKAVQNCINLLELNAQQKEITLTSHISEPTYVFADPDMLDTIIRNLISNALKFTKPQGSITVSAETKGSMVEVSVRDTGIGMKAEVRDNLFRLDSSHASVGTANEKGTGLGLLLCKEMIEKHNGAFHVESEPGNGSTFTFSMFSAPAEG